MFHSLPQHGAVLKYAQRMPADTVQLELEVAARTACDRGDYDRAMTHLIEAYGAELLRFLTSRLDSAEAASEVYSDVAERLWRSLPKFVWRHGARGYCYAIARNCATNYATAAIRKPDRNLPLSQATHASAALERVRTATIPYLKTEIKDRFRELREQLSTEDQTLLTLRLDRQLDFRELAIAMSFDEQDGQNIDEEALAREANRLRQRFKSAKEKLRKYAQDAGLLS